MEPSAMSDDLRQKPENQVTPQTTGVLPSTANASPPAAGEARPEDKSETRRQRRKRRGNEGPHIDALLSRLRIAADDERSAAREAERTSRVTNDLVVELYALKAHGPRITRAFCANRKPSEATLTHVHEALKKRHHRYRKKISNE
jgi:hypothetical protein